MKRFAGRLEGLFLADVRDEPEQTALGKTHGGAVDAAQLDLCLRPVPHFQH